MSNTNSNFLLVIYLINGAPVLFQPWQMALVAPTKYKPYIGTSSISVPFLSKTKKKKIHIGPKFSEIPGLFKLTFFIIDSN